MTRVSGRNIKVFTLLSAIVVGGLLAPTSHLVYMYLSDFHSTEMQHVDLVKASHDASETLDGPIGSRVHAPIDAHYDCPYLALFATSLIAEPLHDDTEIRESDPVEAGPAIAEAPCGSVSFTSYSVRGPPQAEIVT